MAEMGRERTRTSSMVLGLRDRPGDKPQQQQQQQNRTYLLDDNGPGRQRKRRLHTTDLSTVRCITAEYAVDTRYLCGCAEIEKRGGGG